MNGNSDGDSLHLRSVELRWPFGKPFLVCMFLFFMQIVGHVDLAHTADIRVVLGHMSHQSAVPPALTITHTSSMASVSSSTAVYRELSKHSTAYIGDIADSSVPLGLRVSPLPLVGQQLVGLKARIGYDKCREVLLIIACIELFALCCFRHCEQINRRKFPKYNKF